MHALLRMIAAQVAEVPDKAALDFGDHSVSYSQLWARARTLADGLRGGTGPVALIDGQHVDVFAGYLACMMTQRTIVPLSPTSPHARNSDILTAVDATLIISNPIHHAQAERLSEELAIPVLEEPSDLASPVEVERDGAFLYVLFTSGSTGSPKGVPVTWDSALAYVLAAGTRYDIGVGDRVSHCFSLTFDLSVFDLLVTFTRGATLVCPRGRESALAVEYVTGRRLTIFLGVPSSIAVALRLGSLVPDAMPSLRWSIFCGEPLRVGAARSWMQAATRSRLENTYGPTEMTVCVSGKTIEVGEIIGGDESDIMPIGSLYPGLEAVMLDERGRVHSSAGELCVRGAQRMSGYLEPALNQNRFVRVGADGAEAKAVAIGDLRDTDYYRTGDRVRLVEGEFDFIGRVDRQVKVLGFRVELNEVEAALLKSPAVKSAAVVAAGDPTRLAAYVLPELPDLDLEILTNHLRLLLPQYMVPNEIELVDELPMNPNGKVDYGRLVRLWGTRHGHV